MRFFKKGNSVEASIVVNDGDDNHSIASCDPEDADVGSKSDSDVSNSNGTSTGNDQQSTSSGSSSELARAETRAVNRSKLIVFAVIMIAAGAIAGLFYYFLNQEEIVKFHHDFHNLAVEVAELVHFEAAAMFSAVDAFATDISSFGDTMTKMNNGTTQWPNVTIPDFEYRGSEYNYLSKALQTSWVPLVKDEGIETWEAYADANQGWLAESLRVRKEIAAELQTERHLLEGVEDPKIFPHMWRFTPGTTVAENVRQVVPHNSGVDFGPGAHGPIWQQVPAPYEPSIIQFDTLTHEVFQRIYHGMWETAMPVLSEVVKDLDFLYDGAVEDDATHPHSVLLSPVYPDPQAGIRHGKNDLIGMMMVVLSWDKYFVNLLVEGTNGIVMVLHDTCGDHFTYQLNGPEALFLGEGDLHDPAYTYLEYDTEFAPFLKHNFSDTHEHCEYDLRFFPSAEFEGHYRTSKPAIYTGIVLCVFLVTAVVFLLYDYFVQYRQNKVMATAKRTNAIVSSLFPKNVRDRIMEDAKAQAEAEMNGNKGGGFKMGVGNRTKLKEFLDEDLGETGAESKQYDSKPIADLFTDCTILFADLVGFTAWSSVREPAQVFTLLETIFAGFDAIASRRRVFKVETVGDCYVAVTGLPGKF